MGPDFGFGGGPQATANGGANEESEDVCSFNNCS